MATGPQHYRKAEQLLGTISRNLYEPASDSATILAAAQVHATLALAAATALNDTDGGAPIEDYHAWVTAVSTTAPVPVTTTED